MRNRFRRVVAAFSLIALGSVIAAAPANAATPTGVSNATGGVTLLSADLGDLIKATLAGETNSDTIDPANGVPTATEALGVLKVKSALLPALDALSTTVVETTSTGAKDEKTTELFDIPVNPLGVTGTINPATLSSVVDLDGAKSGLSSTVANLNALGVLGIDSASVQLGGLAGATSSNSSRLASIDALSVLDLQALLNLFGLDIGDLDLDTVTQLLDQLGELPLLNQSFSDAADLNAAIADGKALVTTAEATLDAALTALAGLTCPPAPQLLCDAVTTAQGQLTFAETALNNLLDDVFDVLGGTPLVSVGGISVGAVAQAADTVANSAANVTAGIGSLKIGGLEVGPIDANSTLDDLAALANTINGVLQGALNAISPELANILSVKLFDRTTNVAEQNGYVTAAAGITALTVTITPPDICALLNSLPTPEALPDGVQLPPTPVSGVLDELGSVVDITNCFPVAELAPAAIGDPQPNLVPVGSTLNAISNPLTVKAASIFSAANFRVVEATPEIPAEPQLPRTGMNEMLLLVVGGLMAAAALGLRRVTAAARATRPLD